MNDETAISVKNVSKDFKLATHKSSTLKSAFANVFRNRKEAREAHTQHALKNISFEVKKGEFFGIVGRNGSGKSTLLKMLAGIYQPNKGTVQVRGKLVPFIELGVGFNPELTGRENVYLNGALLGFSKTEVDEFYDEVVAFAELEKFMEQKLKNYSSGMQVRLAFAMAIRAQADILLIDEVLAVGDADFQRKCFEYFKALKKNKTTVVFVTHDMEAVRQYCDRVILIEDNKLLQEGSAERIALAYIRQFNKQDTSSEETIDLGDKRWGDGLVKIEKISVTVHPDRIDIVQTVKPSVMTEACIAGIRVKSSAGFQITGTNTRLERQSLKNLKANEITKLEWTLPNIFSDGSYFIDAAVTHPDEITISDWWEDAGSFKVKKNRQSPYDIDPEFKLLIT